LNVGAKERARKKRAAEKTIKLSEGRLVSQCRSLYATAAENLPAELLRFFENTVRVCPA
jgi:hypothetical protein